MTAKLKEQLAHITKCRNCGLMPIAHRKPDENGHRRCPTPEGLWAERWFQFSPAKPEPQCTCMPFADGYVHYDVRCPLPLANHALPKTKGCQ